jgi:hypothetical protein
LNVFRGVPRRLLRFRKHKIRLGIPTFASYDGWVSFEEMELPLRVIFGTLLGHSAAMRRQI